MATTDPHTEALSEAFLIEKLVELKYEHRADIRDRKALEANFRQKFEALNRVTLTDAEFKRLLLEVVTPDVFAAATRLRGVSGFTRDDGTPLNYTLVNIKDWCKNTFEVVSQLKINTDHSHHRYDVMLLINGVPAVQIELKTLGLSPRRAVQQIVNYKKDPGSGYTRTLLCFVQLFVVSNRTDTLYFTNNNPEHFAFHADERFLPVYRFADEENQKVVHLDAFADAFLAKCTLGRMISRYTVLVATERKLMMMRPYQIYAVQQIVGCIRDGRGNGYVWHTTGSGKTLTSFKASTLLKTDPDLHKVLFVVDRKDLDRQTREEFNRFQANCVEENTNTAMLVERLLSDDYADKVIVTTIQKLGLALERETVRERRGSDGPDHRSRLEALRGERVALIFDECHRSQFGQTHRAIKDFFPRAQVFGFTGTPIFEENSTAKAIEGDEARFKTTEELFEKRLHAYTITHAIEDRNVLRFHVDYYQPQGDTPPPPGSDDAKRAVVEAILSTHDAATASRRFNALFATASINDAIAYHGLFERVQAERAAEDPGFVPLKVAALFSPPAEGNADIKQLQEDLAQEQADNRQQPDHKKAALAEIIGGYNARYGTNFSVAEFDLYHKDVQARIKSQGIPDADLPGGGAEKVDVTIVVDMLLTGFDAKHLNTLYVDKNLKHHGLIQAFSRTNRVLNDTKPHGQVLDFRGQEEAVDEAVTMFSGVDAGPADREVWLVDRAPVVVERLKAAKADLDAYLESQGVEASPTGVVNLRGDEARAGFVRQFKEVQRLQTQLDQYTDLTPEQEAEIEETLPADELRGFRGAYLETAKQLRKTQGGDDVPPGVDDLDFELVLFATAKIDYDYIMKLIAELSGQPAAKAKLTRDQLAGLIASDSKFIDEREDILAYVESLDAGEGLSEAQVKAGYGRFKAEKSEEQVRGTAEKHGLAPDRLGAFVGEVLDRMIFDGEKLTDLLEPRGLGWRDRREAELALMVDLVPLLKQRADGRGVSGLEAWE